MYPEADKDFLRRKQMGNPMSSTPTTKLATETIALFVLDNAAKAIAARDPDVAASVRERLHAAFAYCQLFPKTLLEAIALAWPTLADALKEQPGDAERIAQEMQSALIFCSMAMFKEMQNAAAEVEKMCKLVNSSKGGTFHQKGNTE
jgi:hypothetical protein